MLGSVVENVPVEVWARIGDFLTASSDLVILASFSPQALSAAADLTCYLWVIVPHAYPSRELRLAYVVGSVPPIRKTTQKTSRTVIMRRYHQLGCARFTAVIDGRHVTVDLVQDDACKR